MAQHLEISLMKQKVFQKIRQSIINDFKSPYVSGSLKYERLPMGYQTSENDEVYLTNRYIGKGFIWGDTHGSFEIHFDKAKKEISHIYLVA